MDVKQQQPETAQPAPKAPGHEPLMRDYWPHYHRHAIAATLLMQLLTTAVLGMSLVVAGLPVQSPGFWITMLATLLAAGALNIILINLLLTPHRDIVTALTSAAGEKPRLPLPNPNVPRYAKNGFKSILQFIYEDATKTSKPVGTIAPEATNDLSRLNTALNQTKAGVIVMDEDTCMVKALEIIDRFYHHESCGQCSPCREGTGWLHKLLISLDEGNGKLEDIELMDKISTNMTGNTVCVLADAAAMPTQSFLSKFKDEFVAHVTLGRCPFKKEGRVQGHHQHAA